MTWLLTLSNKKNNRKEKKKNAEREAMQNRRTQTHHGGQDFLQKCDQRSKHVIPFPYVFLKMLRTPEDNGIFCKQMS